MRWTKSVSLVAFVLVAVLIASGVAVTVWAQTATPQVQIVLSPDKSVNSVGTKHTVTVTVTVNGKPLAFTAVTFSILQGPHAGQSFTVTTDANGNATVAYSGTAVGQDTIQATVAVEGAIWRSNQVVKQWIAEQPALGTIVIIKDSVPNDSYVFNFSGSGGLGPFSLDGDPNTPLPDTKTFTNLQPDLYTITELFPIPGWYLLYGSVCKFPDGSTSTFGSQATFNLAAGATVTCTFTNYKAGRVIVDKVTVPAGDPQVFNFTAAWASFSLKDTDQPHDSGPIPPTGQGSFFYGLSENPVSGWTTSVACKDPDGGTTVGPTGANIDLDPGETVYCTFTNRKDVVDVKPGTIVIVKDTVPDGPQVFDFEGSLGPFSLDDDPATLLPNTQTFASLTPGTYTVTEKGPPSGWVLSIACKDPDGGTTVGPTGANIDLDPGETVFCTFTNTKSDVKPGTIVIVKDAVPDDPLDFEFGGSWGQFFLDDDGVGGSPLPNTQTFANLTPGTYTVKEAVPPGWVLSIACKDPDGGTTVAGNSANIDLDAGETVTCIFTNKKSDVKGGTIVIIKDTVPDGPQVFDFTGSLGPFSLDDDGVGGSTLPNTQTFANLTPGTYTVTEKGPPSGWVSSIACKDPDGGTTVGPTGANIDLDAGETVTCIFTNKGKDVPPTTYIYSVKIVCGTVTPPRPKPSIPTLRDPAPVVPGLYRTAVNIHNFWEETTTFLQKVAIALPQDQPRGPVTKKVQAKLGPNEAVEVDCYNIVAILGGTTSASAEFLKGFLVIESPVELEVTAVYTAEELQENGISIDVEQIQPHVVRRSEVPSAVPVPAPAATAVPAPAVPR